MALLDAILCREWEFRYYSLNLKWAERTALGHMRDGSGDFMCAFFDEIGGLIIGFAHESEMSPYVVDPPSEYPGVLDSIPGEFSRYVEGMRDSHNGIVDASFCIWRKHVANQWMHGKIEFPVAPDPDGSESLLSPLDGNPSTYHRWAEEYFDPGEFDHEFHIDSRAVQHVFEHRPLNDEIVRQLNPELSLERLSVDVEEIGYPA